MARLARTLTAVGAAAATMMGIGMTAPAAAAAPTFLGSVSTLTTVASTVPVFPANADVNPYGVAVVPQSVRRLHRGSVLVSNFNAATN